MISYGYSDELLRDVIHDTVEIYFSGYRPGEVLPCYTEWAAEVLAGEVILEQGEPA